MMTDFNDAFGKETSMDKAIPDEVLALLCADLPDNFMYIKDKEGKYMAVPRPDKIKQELRLITEFDFNQEKDAELLSRLKKLPREKWAEYFYRTQRIIPVKNMKIGNDEKLISIEKTMGNPLQENEVMVTQAGMYPEKFPDPITIIFESVEGDQVPTKIQQQPYDSLLEIKFQNIDFPALKVELYQYAPLIDAESHEESFTCADNPINFKFSIKPSKARTVREAITALHIFKGLSNGTAKVNGQIIVPKDGEATLDTQQIDDALAFWSTALKLEERLNVSFTPGADFPIEDVRFFDELNTCLINKKEIIWEHPFDYFHMGEYHSVDGKHQIEDLIGRENIRYTFKEGPIAATLLGAEFNIYSHTELRDFIITNIEWDVANKEKCKVYITDAPGKILTLSRLYVTEAEIKEI